MSIFNKILPYISYEPESLRNIINARLFIAKKIEGNTENEASIGCSMMVDRSYLNFDLEDQLVTRGYAPIGPNLKKEFSSAMTQELQKYHLPVRYGPGKNEQSLPGIEDKNGFIGKYINTLIACFKIILSTNQGQQLLDYLYKHAPRHPDLVDKIELKNVIFAMRTDLSSDPKTKMIIPIDETGEGFDSPVILSLNIGNKGNIPEDNGEDYKKNFVAIKIFKALLASALLKKHDFNKAIIKDGKNISLIEARSEGFYKIYHEDVQTKDLSVNKFRSELGLEEINKIMDMDGDLIDASGLEDLPQENIIGDIFDDNRRILDVPFSTLPYKKAIMYNMKDKPFEPYLPVTEIEHGSLSNNQNTMDLEETALSYNDLHNAIERYGDHRDQRSEIGEINTLKQEIKDVTKEINSLLINEKSRKSGKSKRDADDEVNNDVKLISYSLFPNISYVITGDDLENNPEQEFNPEDDMDLISATTQEARDYIEEDILNSRIKTRHNGDVEFLQKIYSALSFIASKPKGKLLIEKIFSLEKDNQEGGMQERLLIQKAPEGVKTSYLMIPPNRTDEKEKAVIFFDAQNASSFKQSVQEFVIVLTIVLHELRHDFGEQDFVRLSDDYMPLAIWDSYGFPNPEAKPNDKIPTIPEIKEEFGIPYPNEYQNRNIGPIENISKNDIYNAKDITFDSDHPAILGYKIMDMRQFDLNGEDAIVERTTYSKIIDYDNIYEGERYLDRDQLYSLFHSGESQDSNAFNEDHIL